MDIALQLKSGTKVLVGRPKSTAYGTATLADQSFPVRRVDEPLGRATSSE